MGFLSRFRRRDLEPITVLALDQGTRGDNRPERREQRRFFGLLKGDKDLREAATTFSMTKFEDAIARGEVAVDETEPGEGRLLKFFQWVLEHKEEIIAFIKLIVGLFAGVPVAAPEVAFARRAPVGAAAFPAVDVGLVTQITEAIEVARAATEALWELIKQAGGTLPGRTA